MPRTLPNTSSSLNQETLRIIEFLDRRAGRIDRAAGGLGQHAPALQLAVYEHEFGADVVAVVVVPLKEAFEEDGIAALEAELAEVVALLLLAPARHLGAATTRELEQRGALLVELVDLQGKVLASALPAVDAEGRVQLPDANVIVNPSQPGCGFESKALAGVGVMFYVLLALRAELRQRGRFDAANQPRLDALLDLVALGTVADVVKLDYNNRILVAQGLARIRAGRARPGLMALLEAAGRTHERVHSSDLGFLLGPRLNAAGRLDDMRRGIECLLAPDRDSDRKSVV